MSKIHVLDTYCTYCDASPGASCRTPSGKRVEYHAARIKRFKQMYRSNERELSVDDLKLARRLLELLGDIDLARVIQVRLDDGSILTVQPIHSDDYEWVSKHGTTAGHWRKRAG